MVLPINIEQKGITLVKGEGIKSFIDFDQIFHQSSMLPVYKEINSSLWKDFEKGNITTDKLKTLRFKLFFNEIKIKLNAEDFSGKYLHHLSKASFLIDGAEEFVQTLSKIFRLAIITNGLSKVQRPRLTNSTIHNFFEDIFISEEICIPKPEPAYFDFVLEKLNALKDQNNYYRR
ncbi:MAG: HAD-IA family hydrolase [Bacteroidota bacterium]